MLDTTLANKTVNHVHVSSALIKRAMAELTPFQNDAEKAAALRPSLVEGLVAAGAVSTDEVKQAEALLATHEGTAQLLQKAAGVIKKIHDERAAGERLGKSVDTSLSGGSVKKAEYDSLTDPFLGKHTSEKKASDRAYEQALMGR